MKKITIFLATLMGLAAFFSCKKYLDVKPKGYIIPQTTDDLERVLNGLDLQQVMPIELEKLSDDYFLKDVDKASLLKVNSVDSRIYLWLAGIYSTPDEWTDNAIWNMMYKNIYQYNAVINNIDAADGGTPQRKAIARSQALLGRAWCYWYLVNLYCKPFDPATASDAPGVPWITTNDISAPVPGRSTLQATCNLIRADLEEALKNLPASTTNPYLFTRAAGLGLFARTMLMQRNYADAAKMADSALKYNDRLINYNTVYQTSDGRYTPIIDAPFGNMLTSPENIHVHIYSNTRGLSGLDISPATARMFETHDLRNIFIKPDTATNTTTGKLDTSYIYNADVVFINNISITTPEMYLVRAESNIRLGRLSDAMADINLLRKNRIVSAYYKPLEAANATQAMNILLAERRKELLGHGARWFDMRRLNNDPVFGFTAHHYLQDGTSIDLPPNSNRYTLLIPPTALTKDITQNP
ncbi:RagB/SusD family nutrient uptake outer membrane protein [Chitinophaga sp. OAE865]|uniref:RagB/SusD family nutrient uptake outer membrane protein n=1 Tax=Chitinophaga sp. OAE865 TaxID=2817898 RepID=UPI001AE4376A